MNYTEKELEHIGNILEVLPFQLSDITYSEENCGSVWIEADGKTYSITVYECVNEEEL